MPLVPQPPPPAGGALLARLHAINARYGYLPEEELHHAASDLGMPLSQVYNAASFYAVFLVLSRVAATPSVSVRGRPVTSGAAGVSWKN